MRRAIASMVLVLAAVGVPAAAAGARAPGLTCGQPITASVRLTHDLTCPQGFLVGDLSGVGPPTAITVDLDGHTLGVADPSGEVPCGLLARAACVISADRGADLTVKDGTVAGPVGEVGGGLVLARVQIDGNVYLDDEAPGVVERVHASQVDGFVLVGSGTDVISRDVIRGGIDVDDSAFSVHLTITDNLITGGPADGIDLDIGSSPEVVGAIAGNVISDSAGSGISAPGQNLDGLRIDRNQLVSNGGDGLTIGDPSASGDGASATITRNTAVDNAGHGFDVTEVPGDTFTDGGHNVATGNLTAPECLGVRCRS